MKMSYAQHIAQLAVANHIIVDEHPDIPPHGGVARIMAVATTTGRIPARVIQIHPVIDETTYCVALHEMGHLCAPGGMVPIDIMATPFQIQCHKIDQEDAAWRWAREHAMEWTGPMESVYAWARETYRAAVVEKYKAQMPAKRGRPLSEVFGPRK